MTLHLILTRHGKSDWSSPALDDHARPLNKRGRASATAIGEWLAGRGWKPDQVLISSATRTQQTWAHLARAWPDAPGPDIRPDLYLAEPEEMLAVLRRAWGRCVLLIGHNPGSAWLAHGLARRPPSDPRFRRYPTAATTVFEFPATSWAEVGTGTGEITAFVVPRDLL